MFKLNKEALTAEVSANEGIRNPADLRKEASVPQMKLLAAKFMGKDFEKGTTKEAASVSLFDSIAASLGYTPEEIKAGLEFVYPVVEKPVKAPKAPKVPKEPKERSVGGKNFTLANGTVPVAAEGLKVKWNAHAQVFADAVVALIGEGKVTATREELCTKADSLNIRTIKVTTQEVGQLFSFWRPTLIEAGYLVEIKAEPKVVVEAPAEVPAQ